MDDAVLVLDVGKTNVKLSLLSDSGDLIAARTRANAPIRWRGRRALDAAGVGDWLAAVVSDLAAHARVRAVAPVAHGAAAAFVGGARLLAPPMCYEDDAPNALSGAYARLRGAFSETGSPRLPNGLNLGAQLYWLEEHEPALWRGEAQIMPYAQYWAWFFSGVAASEVTSLGCHTDLWNPFERGFSALARTRTWARRFAPLRDARAPLGEVSPAWARAGLPADCQVFCGVHDSNAAFFGARAFPELAGRDVAVLSTGTWFVSMRAPAYGARVDAAELDEARDTLVNVDVEGAAIPSARFMGGREAELMLGADAALPGEAEAAEAIIARGVMALPCFAPGVGPFPRTRARWLGEEPQGALRRAAAGIYLALVADVSLGLIGACDAIVIEGRFAADHSFTQTLAALRPDCDIYTAPSADSLTFGAARLAFPALAPRATLKKVRPLAADVAGYGARWRNEAGAAP